MAALVITAGSRRCARAELLEVRQVAGGMECPECARGLLLKVKSIPGVEAAETSWNRRMLSVRFHAGSHATLAQIRNVVAGQHFQAREAEIVIAGRLVVDGSGALSLQVPETGLAYRVDLTGRDPSWRRAFTDRTGERLVVTGRVPGLARDQDPLVLFPVDFPRPATVLSSR